MDPKTLSLANLEAFDPRAKAGRPNRRFLCPFCHGDRKQDDAHRCLSVNVNTGAWVCPRCNSKGLLMEYRTHRPELGNKGQPKRKPSPFTLQPKAPPAPDTPTDRGYDYGAILRAVKPLDGSPAAAYLAKRGIPFELIPTGARIRYMPASPSLKIRESVAFGLIDSKGQPVGLQLRNIEGDFKTTRKGPDGPFCFATPGALEASRPIVTEAPIDALTLAACGYPAVATCGTSFPDDLAALFVLRSVVLAHDADPPGDKAAETAAAKLQTFGASCIRLKPEGAKDWNEYAQRYGLDALRRVLDDLLKPTPPANANTAPNTAPEGDKAPAVDPFADDDEITTDSLRAAIETVFPESRQDRHSAPSARPDHFKHAKPSTPSANAILGANSPIGDGWTIIYTQADLERILQTVCPVPDHLARSVRFWDVRIMRAWAWLDWCNRYSRQTDAPKIEAVTEAVAYVIARWKAESRQIQQAA